MAFSGSFNVLRTFNVQSIFDVLNSFNTLSILSVLNVFNIPSVLKVDKIALNALGDLNVPIRTWTLKSSVSQTLPRFYVSVSYLMLVNVSSSGSHDSYPGGELTTGLRIRSSTVMITEAGGLK